MTFQKGVVTNPNGRGNNPNKLTTEVRLLLLGQVEPHMSKVGAMLDKIKDPIDFITALSKILPYIAPRLQAKQIDLRLNGQRVTVGYESPDIQAIPTIPKAGNSMESPEGQDDE